MAAQAPAASGISAQQLVAQILIGTAIGAGTGGIAAALFTSAPVAAGILVGGTWLPVTLLVGGTILWVAHRLPGRLILDLQSERGKMVHVAISVLAAAGAGFLLPTLLGYSITWGAVAAIDLCVTATSLAYITSMTWGLNRQP